ncbi:phosphoribosylaminoimidazolecarboxamide formyltransferase [Streptococcus suis]|uniref:phosphoribosylaminoimidazolecarboxamide formyltransferase n=1 Tax=Streptococcus suis TaxID=1307 RepID=UPI00147859E7|nr:phosphoribosylaminoimidazolecarboxamide formyltransferase [Streptococcus suis]
MIKKIISFILTFILAALLFNSFIFVNLENPARLILAYGLSLILSGFLMTQVK